MKAIFHASFFLFSILFFGVSLFAGNKPDKGYYACLKMDGAPEQMLYLHGNTGYEDRVVDSAFVKKGQVVFRSSSANLPEGIYRLLDANGNEWVRLVLQPGCHFRVNMSFPDPYLEYKIENSDENQLLFGYEQVTRHRDSIARVHYEETVLTLAPKSLTALYIRCLQIAVSKFVDISAVSSLPTREITDTGIAIFDNMNFADARILHIPVDYKVEEYLQTNMDLSYDSLAQQIQIKNIGYFINQVCLSPSVKNYFLKYILFKFYDDLPSHDAVIVHLYDTYCSNGTCEWLDPYMNRRLQRDVKIKRKLLPGAIVPVLEAFNPDGKIEKTSDIKNKYILLWFWDPDCDHCILYTPVLHRFYQENKDLYDMEVYAISISEDLQRWNQFIEEQHLLWDNVSYAAGPTNYDFVEYFDILTTPVLFLINREHKIILRNNVGEDFSEYELHSMLNSN